MKVVGYYDMRPVDWASGKRMPLEPGEGHTCDRCGAEHAIVFEVQDTETGKVYAVGSTCAKQSFGFEVEKDVEGKKLIKSAKQKALMELDTARQELVLQEVTSIVHEVGRLAIPECTMEMSSSGIPIWRCGDSVAWAQHRSDEETKRLAIRGWLEKRMEENIPMEWSKIDLLYAPERKSSREVTTMARKALMVGMRFLDPLQKRY
jgi:hypothetical protein